MPFGPSGPVLRAGGAKRPKGILGDLRGFPSKEQISKDFGYFKSVASSRESWFDAVNYFLFRNLNADWYNGEYYLPGSRNIPSSRSAVRLC